MTGFTILVNLLTPSSVQPTASSSSRCSIIHKRIFLGSVHTIVRVHSEPLLVVMSDLTGRIAHHAIHRILLHTHFFILFFSLYLCLITCFMEESIHYKQKFPLSVHNGLSWQLGLMKAPRCAILAHP